MRKGRIEIIEEGIKTRGKEEQIKHKRRKYKSLEIEKGNAKIYEKTEEKHKKITHHKKIINKENSPPKIQDKLKQNTNKSKQETRFKTPTQQWHYSRIPSTDLLVLSSELAWEAAGRWIYCPSGLRGSGEVRD